VSEQLLDGAQVSPPVEQVGREAMTQRVWARRRAQAEPGQVVLEEAADAPGREPVAVAIEEDRSFFQPAGLPDAEPVPQAGGGHPADRAEALAATLAPDADQLLLEVEVPHVQPDQLADPQAARRRASRTSPGREGPAACR